MNNYGILTNYVGGTLTNYAGGTLTNYATLTNYGTIYNWSIGSMLNNYATSRPITAICKTAL